MKRSPPEPDVTDEQMEATLRDVLPRVRPGTFRAALLSIADNIRARRREPGSDEED